MKVEKINMSNDWITKINPFEVKTNFFTEK